MVSRTGIASLTRKVDALVLALRPASELPPCPPICLAINGGGNTPQERQAIAAYFERSELRRKRITFDVTLDFSDTATTGDSNGDVPQSVECAQSSSFAGNSFC